MYLTLTLLEDDLSNGFETILTYLNLSYPNLIDVPYLPTLLNLFETNLTCLNLS